MSGTSKKGSRPGDTTISQRQMATALGVKSKRTIEKRIGQGMPMNSVEAARAWCELNLGETRGPGVVATDMATEAATETGSRSQVAKEEKPLEEASDEVPSDDSLQDQKTLNRKLTAARIKLTERDTAIRSLQAAHAKIEADLRDRKLLRAEEEYRKNFERAVVLRTKLLDLPAQWALQLAAITDPGLVAEFTRKRIKAALIEYCEAFGVRAES